MVALPRQPCLLILPLPFIIGMTLGTSSSTPKSRVPFLLKVEVHMAEGEN